MTKIKLFIFICFCALSTITQAQYILQLSDVTFSDGEITDYTNTTEKNIIIPDNFDGVAVETIGDAAFYDNQLTEVIIGNSVNSIGYAAFYGNQLTQVIIGNSVESIGDYAFIGNQLTEVIIPNSVTSIGESAFDSNKLTEVSIGDHVTSIGNVAFYGNQLTNVSIPNSVKSIGEYAFSENPGLTSFNLPTHYQGSSYPWSNGKKSGDEITDFALSYELDEDSKGNAVDFTISYTLDGGTNAANNPADYTVETATITLADASKTGRTFKGWYSEAAFTNQVTEIATGSIGDISLYAKYSDEYTLQLSDVTFSDGEITDYTNTTEKNIIIPNNFDGVAVETIGYAAFWNNQLTQVNIGNSVKSIGAGAFQENKLTEVIIGNSVKSIGESAFRLNQLTEVIIPNSVNSIGKEAFRANNLTHVSIGNSVKIIGDAAFYGTRLTEVSIPNSVNSIGKEAFRANGLTEVSIPTSVNSIGDDAFRNNQLTEVSIPNSVTSIGENAFYKNTGLTSFNLPTHHQGYSYSWSNSKKSGDEITDLTLSYELDEGSKGNAVDFTISYILDGGTNDANNPADYTVETATITLEDASKDGYTFEGWYSEAAFTNQVTEIATGSTGDVVLFAKYSEIALGIYITNIKVFNFYPNPSIDFIQTELEVSSLTIRSISGSKVKQFEGGSFFDISNLKSGVYILLAIDKNGDTYKSKLLKE